MKLFKSVITCFIIGGTTLALSPGAFANPIPKSVLKQIEQYSTSNTKYKSEIAVIKRLYELSPSQPLAKSILSNNGLYLYKLRGVAQEIGIKSTSLPPLLKEINGTGEQNPTFSSKSTNQILQKINTATKPLFATNVKASSQIKNSITSLLYDANYGITPEERTRVYSMINSGAISAKNALYALSRLAPSSQFQSSDTASEIQNYLFFINTGITHNPSFQKRFDKYVQSESFQNDVIKYLQQTPNALTNIINKTELIKNSSLTSIQKQRIALFLMNNPSYHNQIKTLIALNDDKKHPKELRANLQTQQATDLKTLANYFKLSPPALNNITSTNSNLAKNLADDNLKSSSADTISAYQTTYINSLAMSAGLTTLPKGYLQFEGMNDNISNQQLEDALKFLKQSNDGTKLQLKTIALIELNSKKAENIFNTLSKLQLLQSDYAPNLMIAYENNSPVIRAYLNKHDDNLIQEAIVKHPDLQFVGTKQSSQQFAKKQSQIARFLMANPKLESLVRVALKAHLLNMYGNNNRVTFYGMTEAQREASENYVSPALSNLEKENPQLMAYVVGFLKHFDIPTVNLPVTKESIAFEKQLSSCNSYSPCHEIDVNNINSSLSPSAEYNISISALQHAIPAWPPMGVSRSAYEKTRKQIQERLENLGKTATPQQLGEVNSALGYLLRSMVSNQAGSGGNFQQKSYNFVLAHPKIFDGYYKILTGLGLQNFLKGEYGSRYGIQNQYLNANKSSVAKISKKYESLFNKLKLSDAQKIQISSYLVINPKMQDVIIANLRTYQSIVPLYTDSLKLQYSDKWPRYIQKPNAIEVNRNLYTAPPVLHALSQVFPHLMSDTVSTMYQFGISPLDQTKLNQIGIYRNPEMYGDVVQKAYLNLSQYIPEVTQVMRKFITGNVPKFEVDLATQTIKSLIDSKQIPGSTKKSLLSTLGENPYYALTVNALIAYHKMFKDNKANASKFADLYPKTSLLLDKAYTKPGLLNGHFITNPKVLSALGVTPTDPVIKDTLSIINKVNQVKSLTNSEKTTLRTALLSSPPYNTILQTSLNSVFYSDQINSKVKNQVIKAISRQITKDGAFRTSNSLDLSKLPSIELGKYLGISSKAISDATVALQQMGGINSKTIHVLYTTYPTNTAFAQAITTLNSLPIANINKLNILKAMESYITYDSKDHHISIAYKKNDLSDSLSLIYDSINYLKLKYNKNDAGHKNLLYFSAQHYKETGDILRQLNDIPGVFNPDDPSGSMSSMYAVSGLDVLANSTEYYLKGKDKKIYTAQSIFKPAKYQAGLYDKPQGWDKFKDEFMAAVKGMGKTFEDPFKKEDGSWWHRIKGLMGIVALAVAPIDPAGDVGEAVELTDEMTDAASMIEDESGLKNIEDIEDVSDVDDASDSENLPDKIKSRTKTLAKLFGKAETVKDDGNSAMSDAAKDAHEKYKDSFYKMLSEVHDEIRSGNVSKDDLKVLNKGDKFERLGKAMEVTGHVLSKGDDGMEFVKVFETERQSFLRKLGGSLEELKDTDGEDSEAYKDAQAKHSSLNRKIRFAKAMELIGKASETSDKEQFVDLDAQYAQALTGNKGPSTAIGHLRSNLIFGDELMNLDKESDMEGEQKAVQKISEGVQDPQEYALNDRRSIKDKANLELENQDSPPNDKSSKISFSDTTNVETFDKSVNKTMKYEPLSDEQLEKINSFFKELKETPQPEIPKPPALGAEDFSPGTFDELFEYENKLVKAGHYLEDLGMSGLENESRWDTYTKEALSHVEEYTERYDALKEQLQAASPVDVRKLGVEKINTFIDEFDGVSEEFKESLKTNITKYLKDITGNDGTLHDPQNPFTKFESSADLSEAQEKLLKAVKVQVEYKREIYNEAYRLLYTFDQMRIDNDFAPDLLRTRILITSKFNDYDQVVNEIQRNLDPRIKINTERKIKYRAKSLDRAISDFRQAENLIPHLESAIEDFKPPEEFETELHQLNNNLKDIKSSRLHMLDDIKTKISRGDIVKNLENKDWIDDDLRNMTIKNTEQMQQRIIDKQKEIESLTEVVRQAKSDTQFMQEVDYYKSTLKEQRKTSLELMRLANDSDRYDELFDKLKKLDAKVQELKNNTKVKAFVDTENELTNLPNSIKSTENQIAFNEATLQDIDKVSFEESTHSPQTAEATPVSEDKIATPNIFGLSQLEQHSISLDNARAELNTVIDQLTIDSDSLDEVSTKLNENRALKLSELQKVEEQFDKQEKQAILFFRGIRQNKLANKLNQLVSETDLSEYASQSSKIMLKQGDINENLMVLRELSSDLEKEATDVQGQINQAKKALSSVRAKFYAEAISPDAIEKIFPDYHTISSQGATILSDAPEVDESSFIEKANRAMIMREQLEIKRENLLAEFDHSENVDHHQSLEKQLSIINKNKQDLEGYISGLARIGETKDTDVANQLLTRDQQVYRSLDSYISLLDNDANKAGTDVEEDLLNSRIKAYRSVIDTKGAVTPLMKAEILSSDLAETQKAPFMLDSFSSMQDAVKEQISILERRLSPTSTEQISPQMRVKSLIELGHMEQIGSKLDDLKAGREFYYVQSAVPYTSLTDIYQLTSQLSHVSIHDTAMIQTDLASIIQKSQKAQVELNTVLQSKFGELKEAQSTLRQLFPGDMSKDVSIPHVDDTQNSLRSGLIKIDTQGSETMEQNLTRISQNILTEEKIKAIEKFKTIYAETNALKSYNSQLDNIKSQAAKLLDISNSDKIKPKYKLNVLSSLKRALDSYQTAFNKGTQFMLMMHKANPKLIPLKKKDLEDKASPVKPNQPQSKAKTFTPENLRSSQPSASSGEADTPPGENM